MTDHVLRRKEIRASVEETADALLVTDATNVRYLTGFTGSNAQLLLSAEPIFFTDGRYTEQSSHEVPDVERRIYAGSGLASVLADAVRERGIRRLGVEASHVTLAGHERFSGAMEGIELVPTTDVVEAARRRKSADEVDAIRRAQRIAEDAVTRVLGDWRGGDEIEMALALEWAIRTGGAEGVSFEVIVAGGAHAALPHARPRTEPVGDAVLVDIGARTDGYCSDMTRTYLRNAPEPLDRVHAAVVRAVEAAVEAVRPGVAASDVDRAARDVLAAEGWGEAFVHSTGHGVGLDIHEGPRLSATSEDVLEAGMVITIEPGVYLPGVGGVRVEDLVVVTDAGGDVLTRLDRGPTWPGSV